MGSAASRTSKTPPPIIVSRRTLKLIYTVTSSAKMSAVKNLVEKQIAENPVVVYSKSNLPDSPATPVAAQC